jgi:hypothetical protein
MGNWAESRGGVLRSRGRLCSLLRRSGDGGGDRGLAHARQRDGLGKSHGAGPGGGGDILLGEDGREGKKQSSDERRKTHLVCLVGSSGDENGQKIDEAKAPKVMAM